MFALMPQRVQTSRRLALHAQLRVSSNRRLRVARHLDLRNHGDVPLTRILDDFADLTLRVETAVRLFVEAVWISSLMAQPRFFAPRSNLREARVLFDLNAPALIVGEVPVESVQFVQGQQIDKLEDKLLRHEMAAHVEHGAAPAEARLILNVHGRQVPDDALFHLRGEYRRRKSCLKVCTP